MRPVFPYQWGKFKPPPGTRVDPGHPLAQGLIIALLCNEGGGTKLYDATGRQLSLSATGAPNWSAAVPTGFPGRSFAADASNYYAGGAILTVNSFSMLAGVTPNGFTVAEIIGDSVGAAPNLRMDVSSFARLQLVKAGTAVLANGGTTLVAGRPYVAGTVHTASSSSKLFLNGYIDATGSGTTFSHGNLQIGVSTGEGFGFNGGTISFVYIWDRVLTDQQMIQVSTFPYIFFRRPARMWGVHPLVAVDRDERIPILSSGELDRDERVPILSSGEVDRDERIPIRTGGTVVLERDEIIPIFTGQDDQSVFAVEFDVLQELSSPLYVQFDIVSLLEEVNALEVRFDIVESNQDALTITFDVVKQSLRTSRVDTDVQAPVAEVDVT